MDLSRLGLELIQPNVVASVAQLVGATTMVLGVMSSISIQESLIFSFSIFLIVFTGCIIACQS